MFATGKTTGTVLDAGEGVTHTVPIFEGYAIPHAITPIPISGHHLTRYMLELIKQIDPTQEWATAEHLKINYGEVAMDYDAHLKGAKDNTRDETYILPGGNKITKNFRTAMIECPE